MKILASVLLATGLLGVSAREVPHEIKVATLEKVFSAKNIAHLRAGQHEFVMCARRFASAVPRSTCYIYEVVDDLALLRLTAETNAFALEFSLLNGLLTARDPATKEVILQANPGQVARTVDKTVQSRLQYYELQRSYADRLANP